jgi:hypothetical protein
MNEPAHIDLLVERYLDSSLDEAGYQELETALNESPALRQRYLEGMRTHASLQVLLRGVGEMPAADDRVPAPTIPGPTTWRLHPRQAALAAGVLLAVLLGLYAGLSRPAERPAAAEVIAGLSLPIGADGITIERAGKALTPPAECPLRDGDSINVASDRIATVAYVDEATTLELQGPCRITLRTESAAKRVDVASGAVVCTVQKQPEGRPMIVSSPWSRATVVGTVFRFECGERASTLEVSEGRVRLERIADGAAVMVAEGERAEVADGVALAATPSIEHGLVAWWKLDDAKGSTAADASGRGHGGSLGNGPDWVEGKLGGGLAFDGKNMYVDCGNHADFSPRTFTLCAWFRSDTAGAEHGESLISKDNRTQCEYSLGILLRGRLRGRVGDQVLDAHQQLSPGTWHHAALTYDGHELRIYCDGICEDSCAYAVPIADNGESLRMGWKSYEKTSFSGILDDVRLYRLALTADQIRSLAR